MDTTLESSRSLCFWSWNGEMLEEEIIQQMNDFACKGIGGFFIHARAGLQIPYMKDEWYKAVAIAVQQAEILGLDVWLYDEDGWPSGFAGGKVPAEGREHQMKRMFHKYLDHTDDFPEEPIAIFRNTGNAYHCLWHEGMGEWIKEKLSEGSYLVFYYVLNPFYVDLLNKDTVELFIGFTHEEYKKRFKSYFGKTIKGIFTDEPQLSIEGLPWSFKLPDRFMQDNGYSLYDSLPYLVQDLPGYQVRRHDFWKTINQMFVQAFTKTIFDWCNQNGLLFTGHFACEDGLCDQISVNGGVMAHYEYMHVPGIDHLGRRLTTPVLIKQVSSVAHQMGRKFAISESFGCSGWNTGFKDMAWIWGWQAALGITVPCLHLAAYSIKGVRKRDHPVFFSYQEPWWDRFDIVRKYMDGLNNQLIKGERKPQALLVHAMSSIWCEKDPGHNTRIKHLANQFRMLTENLLNLQVDFDYGDETLLGKYGKVAGDKLFVGDISYLMVIIPESVSMERKTAEMILEYARNGGRLVFINNYPQFIEGRPDPLTEQLKMVGGLEVQNRRDILRKTLDYICFKRRITVIEQKTGKVADSIVTHVREEGTSLIAYVWNWRNDGTRDLLIKIEGACKAYINDVVTGSKKLLCAKYDGEATIIPIKLETYGSMLIEADMGTFSTAEKEFIDELQFINHGWTVNDDYINVYTVDCAEYKMGDEEWQPCKPVIHIHDEVFKKLEDTGKESGLIVRYSFIAEFHEAIPKIQLVAETMSCQEVSINGISVKGREIGWWMDKAMGEYDVTDFIKNGKNIIEMLYTLPKWSSKMNVDEAFETEKNRFFYPVEIENVYLRGDFDVRAEGESSNKVSHMIVKPNGFTLVPKSQKSAMHDLTSQGLWFYRGDITYQNRFEVKKQDQTVYLMRIAQVHGIAADLFINNTFVKTLGFAPFEVDITGHLRDGSNEIKLVLYGGNRNALGPHHHIKGENNYVGPAVFKGVRGFEDIITSPEITQEITWTDDYSFVSFGMRDVSIETRKVGIL